MLLLTYNNKSAVSANAKILILKLITTFIHLMLIRYLLCLLMQRY